MVLTKRRIRGGYPEIKETRKKVGVLEENKFGKAYRTPAIEKYRIRLGKRNELIKGARKERRNIIFEILVKDKLGKTYKYNIPVIKVGNSRFRRCSESIISVPMVKNARGWELDDLKERILIPDELKYKTVVLKKGRRRKKGKIIKVVMLGGGSTNPPVGGGLPPIDE